jgi:hypothetical protein
VLVRAKPPTRCSVIPRQLDQGHAKRTPRNADELNEAMPFQLLHGAVFEVPVDPRER